MTKEEFSAILKMFESRSNEDIILAFGILENMSLDSYQSLIVQAHARHFFSTNYVGLFDAIIDFVVAQNLDIISYLNLRRDQYGKEGKVFH